MRKILIIAQKELADYFKTPLAYVVLFVALVVFNIFFYMIVDQNQEAVLRDLFKVMEFMLVFFVPILTMKTFAEEKQAGTLELLQTTPTHNIQIVLGKYLGGIFFMTILIACTGLYGVIIEIYGMPDRSAMLTGYMGLWLEAVFFIAVGLMASSFTRSQTMAAVCSFVLLFALYFLLSFVQYVHGPMEKVIQYIATMTHAENFFQGLITLPDIIYYLSGVALCLAATRVSLENRLWR